MLQTLSAGKSMFIAQFIHRTSEPSESNTYIPIRFECHNPAAKYEYASIIESHKSEST